MARVYVSIGSNIDQERNILACLDALSSAFGELMLSPVYESEAVGFEGENFYNLVAGFDTTMPVGELSRFLRRIESDNGRRREGPKYSSRTLDIDILTYDDLAGEVDGVELPRDEILENAFVLLPLVDVAPDLVHPVTGKTCRQIWQSFELDGQKLWPIDFTWRGRSISGGTGKAKE